MVASWQEAGRLGDTRSGDDTNTWHSVSLNTVDLWLQYKHLAVCQTVICMQTVGFLESISELNKF